MSLTMSYPVMIAVPLDGLRSPVNILKVVVLPAPIQSRRYMWSLVNLNKVVIVAYSKTA